MYVVDTGHSVWTVDASGKPDLGGLEEQGPRQVQTRETQKVLSCRYWGLLKPVKE